MADYDLLIIGGGINGAGIARDAAGRGYKVLLVEMNDLASGTSSWSTKLIHGGLRYLEHYEFRLVREALHERAHLRALAPFMVRPIRFILPHHKGLRPWWMLRLGLMLYDFLAPSKDLPGTRDVQLDEGEYGAPLKADYKRGFEYSDCQVDDARLVVLNALSAKALGAEIRTRAKLTSLTMRDDFWQGEITCQRTGEKSSVSARMIVNAAGPWVDHVLQDTGVEKAAHNLRLVQGSHIIVPKLYQHDRAYIFQNADGRIVFTIPYLDDFTLIGTTDTDFSGDPEKAAITEGEIDYLLGAVAGYFAKAPARGDIVSTYSGVRSLYDDGKDAAQKTTRDYVLTFQTMAPPMLNVLGGKLTTYRHLAVKAVNRVGKAFGERRPIWTSRADKPLPGGDFARDECQKVLQGLEERFPFIPQKLMARLFAAYGTRVELVLAGCAALDDLGQHFGHGLYAQEVNYLIREEWAMTAEDILYRRTKLGLWLSEAQTAALAAYMAQKTGGKNGS